LLIFLKYQDPRTFNEKNEKKTNLRSNGHFPSKFTKLILKS